MATTPWDRPNARLRQALAGISRALPLPEVPLSGLFSPGDGRAWAAGPGGAALARLGSLPQLLLLFWGQAPPTEDKSSPFPSAGCADAVTHSFSQSTQTSSGEMQFFCFINQPVLIIFLPSGMVHSLKIKL